MSGGGADLPHYHAGRPSGADVEIGPVQTLDDIWSGDVEEFVAPLEVVAAEVVSGEFLGLEPRAGCAVENDGPPEVLRLFLDDPEPIVAAHEDVGGDLFANAVAGAEVLIDPNH